MDESAYRTIPLTKGQVTTVDAADYEWLSQYKWFAAPQQATSGRTGLFYATRTGPKALGKKKILMHREILGLQPGDGLIGDHIDTSGTLDNRRSNLRICTHAQNCFNMRPTSKCGLKGVTFAHRQLGTKKWLARIDFSGRKYRLGYFRTPEEAHAAYEAAAAMFFQEFKYKKPEQ